MNIRLIDRTVASLKETEEEMADALSQLLRELAGVHDGLLETDQRLAHSPLAGRRPAAQFRQAAAWQRRLRLERSRLQEARDDVERRLTEKRQALEAVVTRRRLLERYRADVLRRFEAEAARREERDLQDFVLSRHGPTRKGTMDP